jgi:hypothetical protein
LRARDDVDNLSQAVPMVDTINIENLAPLASRPYSCQIFHERSCCKTGREAISRHSDCLHFMAIAHFRGLRRPLALQQRTSEGGKSSRCLASSFVPSTSARGLYPRHVLASAMPVFASQSPRTRYSARPLGWTPPCRDRVPQTTRKRRFLDSQRFVVRRLKVTSDDGHQRCWRS